MKLERHAKIIELINQYAIETQEELASRLNEAGFRVTQATVSRDIRELKEMAEEIAGVPRPVKMGDRVVAKVLYRDGTVLDTIKEVAEI